MSLNVSGGPYYDLVDLKQNIEEDGTTVNDKKLANWGKWVDRKIDDKIRYLFEDRSFPLTSADFTALDFTINDFLSMRRLATAGLEAKFWFETNGQKDNIDKWEKEELPQWVEDLTQVPATTE